MIAAVGGKTSLYYAIAYDELMREPQAAAQCRRDARRHFFQLHFARHAQQRATKHTAGIYAWSRCAR